MQRIPSSRSFLPALPTGRQAAGRLVDMTPRVESTNRSRKISSAFMKLI